MKDHNQKNKEKDHLARLKKEHRKQFFINLKTVCNLLAGYDLYSKLSRAFLEKMYEQRIHQVKVVAGDSTAEVRVDTNLGRKVAGDNSMTRKEVKEWDENIKAFLRISYIQLQHGKDKVALSLMLVEGQTLTALASKLTDDEFPAARETRETLKPYLEADFNKSFSVQLENLLFALGVLESRVDHHFIWMHLDFVPATTKTSFHHTFHLYKVASIKENFKVEGHARPAYRVGWAFFSYGILWSEIKPDLKGLTTDAPLPVFIQHHALQRLDERIGLHPGLMQYAVFDSIRNLNYQVDDKGTVLIDYVFRQKKIGYLAASVVNNRLLIHTFLFITNNGTPEGKKLSKLTGLQAMDKKFLAIDKLSTFLSYNINDNAFVKNIFVKAGCGHLLEIEDLNYFLHEPGKEISAETIANYLKTRMSKH